MIYFKSVRSEKGHITDMQLADDTTLLRLDEGARIKKGDFVLTCNVEPFGLWQKGGVYEVIGFTDDGANRPTAICRFGYEAPLDIENCLHLRNAADNLGDFDAGDIVVITGSSSCSKGFHVGDVAELHPTSDDLFHDLQVTRFDGVIGFVNERSVRLATEAEAAAFQKQRKLHSVGRSVDELKEHDIVKVVSGANTGLVLQISQVDYDTKMIYAGGTWHMPYQVELLAPAESTL